MGEYSGAICPKCGTTQKTLLEALKGLKRMSEKYQDLWLVFALDGNGITAIHAADTTNSEAVHHRKQLLTESPSRTVPFIRVWIEKAVTNHLFGIGGIKVT